MKNRIIRSVAEETSNTSHGNVDSLLFPFGCNAIDVIVKLTVESLTGILDLLSALSILMSYSDVE